MKNLSNPKLGQLFLSSALTSLIGLAPSIAATSAEISASLSANSLGLSSARAAKLNAFYSIRQNQPAWTQAASFGITTADLNALLVRHGLEASKYLNRVNSHCANDLSATFDPPALCELALSEAIIRVSEHVQVGQLDPAKVDFRNIKMTKKTANVAQIVSDTLNQNPQGLINLVDAQAPQHFLYKRHQQALARFNQLKQEGAGWSPLVLNKKRLSLGSKDPAVVTIKNILRAHGYNIPDGSSTFTADLDAAVRDLQRATLVAENGIVDSANTVLFNQFFSIGIDRRIDRLKLDLEKLRWMPTQLESSFVFAGLGEQNLTWYDSSYANGKRIEMRTIVGRPERKTPMMRDTITSVILNPPWTIPPGILAKDKLPLFQKQSAWEMQDYFNTNFYTLVNMKNSLLIDPLSVDWARVTAQNIGFYIRQRPGLHNALGVFKFNLTNPFAIYLHDTNSRQLFSQPQRLLSSGCVRLERPQELAEEILRGTTWDRNKIAATIAQYPNQVPETSTTIGLKNRIPVYLMYMTSSVKEDGVVRFHPDLYGMNALMLKELEATKESI